MGHGYKCFCKKCDYSFFASFGIGLSSPSTNDEETEKMRNGEHGEQGKRFFEENPDGAVTTNYVVTQCKSCGNLDCTYDYDLQIPTPELIKAKQNLKEALERKDPVALKIPPNYIDDILGRTSYITKEKFQHKCKKCGENADIVEDFEEKLRAGDIKCPVCGGKLSIGRYFMWD